MSAREAPRRRTARTPRSADRAGGRHELERLLSKAGACSRKVARAAIEAGRVRVNGVVIVDPLAWFDGRRDRIALDGAVVAPAAKEGRRYLALNKPTGYVTTRSDPDGRPTVYDLVLDAGAWVVPVGRLDLETSGLLLMTNDTAFADRVTSPESHVPKTYRVDARPRLDEAALARLAEGVDLADGPTRPAKVELLGQKGPCTRFALTITEGRNRQVRRMVKAVGAKVERLERVAIGPLALGALARGKWRELMPAEVAALDGAGRKRGASKRSAPKGSTR